MSLKWHSIISSELKQNTCILNTGIQSLPVRSKCYTDCFITILLTQIPPINTLKDGIICPMFITCKYTRISSTTTTASVSIFLPMPITLGQEHWTHEEYGIQVSAGISAKLIATSDRRVTYANGDESLLRYHTYMDGAGITSLPNNGGYVYVSNSETESQSGCGTLQ